MQPRFHFRLRLASAIDSRRLAMTAASSKPSQAPIRDPADVFVHAAESLVTAIEMADRGEERSAVVGQGKRNRGAVKRQEARESLVLVVMSFAITVACVRLFLELTDYPQIGNQDLHIAHVLWGGLLIFIGGLLPLILANRWARTLAALVMGIGMGLFMDEVGKFLTQTNDYFFRPAAPIIYAVFLSTFWLYRRIRRPSNPDPRAEMYRALDGLDEILDSDLDQRELSGLVARLEHVETEAGSNSIGRLASVLREYLTSGDIPVITPPETFSSRLRRKLAALDARIQGSAKFALLLWIGILVLGIYGGRNVFQVAVHPSAGELAGAAWMTALSGLNEQADSAVGWLVAWVGLEGLVGLALIASGVLYTVGLRRRGCQLAEVCLFSYIVGVDMLVFYYLQFQAMLLVAVQMILLWGVRRLAQRQPFAIGDAA
jgi:hypothetical protein